MAAVVGEHLEAQRRDAAVGGGDLAEQADAVGRRLEDDALVEGLAPVTGQLEAVGALEPGEAVGAGGVLGFDADVAGLAGADVGGHVADRVQVQPGGRRPVDDEGVRVVEPGAVQPHHAVLHTVAPAQLGQYLVVGQGAGLAQVRRPRGAGVLPVGGDVPGQQRLPGGVGPADVAPVGHRSPGRLQRRDRDLAQDLLLVEVLRPHDVGPPGQVDARGERPGRRPWPAAGQAGAAAHQQRDGEQGRDQRPQPAAGEGAHGIVLLRREGMVRSADHEPSPGATFTRAR